MSFEFTILCATALLTLLNYTHAATTNGPLAAVSIHSELAYSTARTCAAGCLVFNGIWVCGVNGGYHDLGKDLGCGCSPTNACFCSAGLKSSASSYLSSCISAACKTVGDVSGDVSSMVGLFDGYCATANRAEDLPTKTTVTPVAGKTAGATAGAGAGAGGSANPSATGAAATADGEKKEDGLSKSDTIALAASLGVGIPSLLIAAITLWMKLRDRKKPGIIPSQDHITSAVIPENYVASTAKLPQVVELPTNVTVASHPIHSYEQRHYGQNHWNQGYGR